MNIAIDFDETITRDSVLWAGFIRDAKARGHNVFMVTCRRDTDDNRDTVQEWLRNANINLPVYFTKLGSKIEHMGRAGIKIDIWIDDDPACIIHGK